MVEETERWRSHSPFGVDLVVGLFPFSKYTDGVVCFTPTTRACTVALWLVRFGLNDRQHQTRSPPTFDFFSRQRSHALHTRFLIPPSSGDEGSRGGVITVAPIGGVWIYGLEYWGPGRSGTGEKRCWARGLWEHGPNEGY